MQDIRATPPPRLSRSSRVPTNLRTTAVVLVVVVALFILGATHISAGLIQSAMTYVDPAPPLDPFAGRWFILGGLLLVGAAGLWFEKAWAWWGCLVIALLCAANGGHFLFEAFRPDDEFLGRPRYMELVSGHEDGGAEAWVRLFMLRSAIIVLSLGAAVLLLVPEVRRSVGGPRPR